jgi:Fic family protein
VHLALQERPLAPAGTLAQLTGLSLPAVNKALGALGELGLVREITGRRRNRLYVYDAYLQILSEGTEPL